MSGPGFAKTPEPPYYAVIFTSQRNGQGEDEYAAAAQRMFELAMQQPGCLGAESTRDANGFGITVAYFDSEKNILRWRNHAEHAATRVRGRREWYKHFEVRVARVERAYNGP